MVRKKKMGSNPEEKKKRALSAMCSLINQAPLVVQYRGGREGALGGLDQANTRDKAIVVTFTSVSSPKVVTPRGKGLRSVGGRNPNKGSTGEVQQRRLTERHTAWTSCKGCIISKREEEINPGKGKEGTRMTRHPELGTRWNDGGGKDYLSAKLKERKGADFWNLELQHRNRFSSLTVVGEKETWEHSR